jgi:hypothetical protein
VRGALLLIDETGSLRRAARPVAHCSLGRGGAVGLIPSTQDASLPPSDDRNTLPLARDAEPVCRRGRTRRDSIGPSRDTRNNACRRQGDRVVALTRACRAPAEDDRWRRIRPAAPGADVEPEHFVAGRRRPWCLPRARAPGSTR